MGWYEANVLPRLVDLALGNAAMGKLRARALDGISGTVLEVGFGSGTNLEYYPPEVDKVLAVDPAVVGQKLARRRLQASGIPVEFIGLDGESLPLEDHSVDNVASTWTLCTIPHVDVALTEIRRVLRPEGRLFYIEHGLSADPSVSRWQRRLEPIQQRVAGGCHLTRDHEVLITDAGFRLDHAERFTIAGPKVMCSMYAGRARP